MGGREKGSPARNSSSGGGAAMHGGKKVTSEHGTMATGHGSKNRGHRESERGQANSARPRARPEVAVGAGVAMAGGESSQAHANKAQTAMKHEIESTEGSKGSHRGAKRGRRRLGDGCSCGGADGGSRRCACGFLVHRGMREGARKQQGEAARAGLPFCRGRGAGEGRSHVWEWAWNGGGFA